jgi:hypothetical protein
MASRPEELQVRVTDASRKECLDVARRRGVHALTNGFSKKLENHYPAALSDDDEG